MKKRTGDAWMPAADYGRSLTGLTLNLLVREIKPSVEFAVTVLQADVVYEDPDIAVLQHGESQWMLHADHTYLDHPMTGVVADQEVRGSGAEFRLHHCDPDAAEARARAGGYNVLDATSDKPHGLREVYLIDPAGYLWVLDKPLPS